MRAALHIALHFLVPGLVARFGFKEKRFTMFLWMLAGILIDVDHFFADPIYDPNRCSIGFHPLHQYFLIPIYLGLCFPKKTRPLGIGLCIHLALDAVDCAWMRLF